jgi:hypothetical protein
LHYADTLNQAVSGTRRPNIIWRVQRQQWYLIISKDYKLQSTKVTLHSHHTPLPPSKQRGWIHALTGQYLRYVRSASLLWWMQQPRCETNQGTLKTVTCSRLQDVLPPLTYATVTKRSLQTFAYPRYSSGAKETCGLRQGSQHLLTHGKTNSTQNVAFSLVV